MTAATIGIIAFLILLLLLALGLPVGFGMLIIGFAGFWVLVSDSAAFVKMAITPFDTITNYSLIVLPLFILMAHVAFESGLSKDLYNLCYKWLGHQPGGIAIASVGACAGFAAMSASSVATAATMGLVALPEMKRYNYDPALATGAIAAGGSMGSLIPPSGILILYGILTEQSIGKLFMAGVIPGILEALFYIITIFLLCTWHPSMGPRGPKFSIKEKMLSFTQCGEMIALVILVLGGLMVGWFSPTEAGGVGAFGAIAFSLIRKRLNWSKFKRACSETLQTTGMIYCILIGAFIFNYFIAVSTLPFKLSTAVGGLDLPPLMIMGIVLFVYLILGCFIDAAAMVLLTVPIFYPLVTNLGFHPLWFGIVLVRVVEMAMITPPVGMNVYVIKGVAGDVHIKTIFRGIVPFLFADTCEVLLLLFIPQIVTFLPDLIA